ncbi:MAG TPA: energy transducer TonB [Gemmatimonadales bacterium]|jgi:hypothetical protein
MTESRAWTFVIIGLLVPRALTAQHKTGPWPCSIENAVDRDTLDVTVSLRAMPARKTTADEGLTRLVSAAFRRRLDLPPSIGSAYFPITAAPYDKPHRGSLQPKDPFGVFDFVVMADGSTSLPRWLRSTGDSATDAAFTAAMRRLDRDDGSRLLANLGRPDTVRVEIIANDSVSLVVPLSKMRVPLVARDLPPRLIRAPSLHYPPDKRAAGVEGVVVLRYAINESGATIPESIEILSASDRAFIEPAAAMAASAVYRSGQVGRCHVKYTVEQQVNFTIGRT